MSAPDHEDGFHFSTLSGVRIDLRNIKASDMILSDIAIGLANQPRYNGQTRFPFSIGQHTVALWDYADLKRMNAAVKRELLLHDMPEFITGDIVTGVKRMLQPAYSYIDENVDATIRQAFKLDHPTTATHDAMRRLDWLIYVSEALILQGRTVTGTPVDPEMSRRVHAVLDKTPAQIAKMLIERCEIEGFDL